MNLKHLSVGKRRALLMLCIVICVACLPFAGRVDNQWVVAVCGVGILGSIISLFRLRNSAPAQNETNSERFEAQVQAVKAGQATPDKPK